MKTRRLNIPTRKKKSRNARPPFAQRLSCFLLAAFVLLYAALGASAKTKRSEAYALIYGTVWTPDYHSAYGVKVKIRRADEKKPHWEVYSNHTGEFAQRVPAGKADYIVTADVKGFKLPSGKRLQPGQDVTVHIENDERADIGVHLTW